MLTVLFVGSLLQDPGRTTFDTKFDLTADPARLLERIAHAWNPTFDLGQMDDQVYGYLFPHGLWFWTFAELHIAAWLSQRVFSGLILVVACEGARRLARAVGLRDAAAVMAGAAYATAPRLLGLSGVLSGEILPTAVLPWIVLPLLLGLAGRMSPFRAALWSGVALLFTGGINAVENWALLPLAAILLATGLRSAPGRRLAGWWVLALTMATVWWILPVFILLRYSPPFLDFIETARATSDPVGWANGLRGADHWVGFVTVGNQPWWPAAHDLAVDPWLVVVTGLVAALSVTGLVRRDMPLRGPLLASALLGMICLTLPHAGSFDSPFGATMRDLLDGPLAPVRNIHKVDPLVRLPLALGLGHLVEVATSPAWRAGRHRLTGAVPAGVSLAVVGVLVACSAAPLFRGDLRTPGWDAVPQAWPGVARAVAADDTGASTLVLPEASFSLQPWGWTIDPPLQAYATSPWVARSQVPLVPGPMIRYLDALAGQSETGSGSLVLAQALARLGIGHVVVRRDLDPNLVEAATPDRVIDSLERSPGLTHERSFGTTPTGLPMLELFRVDDPAPRVEAVPVHAVRSLTGGPDDVTSALGLGVLDPQAPTVIGALPWQPDAAPDLVGDLYRRVDRAYGRIHDATSQVQTADEPSRTDRATADYPSIIGIPRVVARYTGARAVTASTAQGYVDTVGPVLPGHGPAAAVDGDLTTSWRSSPYAPSAGQWVDIRLRRNVPVTRVAIAVDDGPGQVVPTSLTITAGDERRTVGVDPVTGDALAVFDEVQTDHLRVTVSATDHPGADSWVGLDEVSIRGVAISRWLVVPDSGAGSGTTFVFGSTPAARACYPTPFGLGCDGDDSANAVADPAGLNRVFTVHQPGRWEARGTVVAATDPAAADLLRLRQDRMWATASSTLGGDLQVSPGFAVDGSPATPWLASNDDRQPVLHLDFPRRRVLRRIVVTPAAGRATDPTTAIITARGQRRRVDLSGDGAATFRPMDAAHVDVQLAARPGSERAGTPLGLAEIRFNGTGRLTQPYQPANPTGAPCGLGPVITVDGTSHRTSVSGNLSDLVSGTPLTWRVCDGPVRLAPGTHRLRVLATPQFVPDALALVSLRPRPSKGERREVTVRAWGPTDRTVHVGMGPESVLRVAENTNLGWQATLDGKPLATVAVDGTQQGYVVPAGKGGDVRLKFVADTTYRLFLGVGILAALLLAAAGAVDLLRTRGHRRVTAPDEANDLRRRSRLAVHGRRRWLWCLGAGVLLGGVAYAAGGSAFGVALGLTVVLAGRAPTSLPWWLGAAGLALTVSVVINALSDGRVAGQPPAAAELLASAAAGIWAGTVLRDLGRTREQESVHP
ncbi:MAG: alpha-(1-_3)-arabinofuranosyltransferase domain-containing protein [Nocardioides sp.]